MVTKEEIADALAVEKATHAAYIQARERREQLQTTAACEEYKVGIGMIVADRRNRKGVVVRVKPWADDRPWIFAQEIKKDGSKGKREFSMFGDWKVVE